MSKQWLFYLFILSSVFVQLILSIKISCHQTYPAENGNLCYPCSSGYYKVSDCIASNEQARCKPCYDGAYQPYCDNATTCASCTPYCQPGQVKVKNCTATSNIECECKAGSYWKPYAWKPDEGHCERHSTCKKEEELIKAGTPYEDTICAPCKEGLTYFDTTSKSCKACSVCNTKITKNCSARHDVVCDHQLPEGPSPTGKSSKGLDGGVIAAIVVPIVVAVIAVGLGIFIWKRRNQAEARNMESNKVDLPISNLDVESGNRIGSDNSGNTETQNVPLNDITSGSLHSQSKRRDKRSDCDPSAHNAGFKSETETENEEFCDRHDGPRVGRNSEDSRSVRSQQLEGKSVAGSEPVNGHTSSETTESCQGSGNDENNVDSLQQGKHNSEMQIEDDDKLTEVSNGTIDEPRDIGSESLKANEEKSQKSNMNKVFKEKKSYAKKVNKHELQDNNDGGNDISTDADAVPARTILRTDSTSTSSENILREYQTGGSCERVEGGVRIELATSRENNTTGQAVTDLSEITASDLSEISAVFEDVCEGGEQAQLNEDIVWYTILDFLVHHLNIHVFKKFIRRLAVTTNGEFFKTIDVEIENSGGHMPSHEQMYQLMRTWRQATPGATPEDVLAVLEGCNLNAVREGLLKSLGKIDISNTRKGQRSTDGRRNEIVTEPFPHGELSTLPEISAEEREHVPEDSSTKMMVLKSIIVDV